MIPRLIARLVSSAGFLVLSAGFFHAWVRPRSEYGLQFIRDVPLYFWFEITLALLSVFLALGFSDERNRLKRFAMALPIIAVALLFVFLPTHWWLKDPATAAPWLVFAAAHLLEATLYWGGDAREQRRAAIIAFLLCWGVMFLVVFLPMPYFGLTPWVQTDLKLQGHPPNTAQNWIAALAIYYLVRGMQAALTSPRTARNDA